MNQIDTLDWPSISARVEEALKNPTEDSLRELSIILTRLSCTMAHTAGYLQAMSAVKGAVGEILERKKT